MAESVKVDELFVALGLDLNQFDSDLITADSTVKANIAKLRAENNNIRLKMDVDTANLGPAASKTSQLKIQEAALTQEIYRQKAILTLMNAEYERANKNKELNAYTSQKMQSAILREQRALANMQNQLKSTQLGQSIKGQITGIASGITGIDIAALKTMGTVALVVGAVNGIKSMTKEAAASGEALYQMSQRLHITTAEAGMLSKMLQIGGVDSQTFTSTMMRLDKQVLSAGEDGNGVTKALERFGVSVKDANGRLLPMNKQLEALAEGYRVAAAAGEQDAYVAQVLGARGQALIPLLQRENELREAASKIESPNISAEEAHKLRIESIELEMQMENLKKSFGAAFIPLANEMIPAAVDAMQQLTKLMKGAREILPDISVLGKMYKDHPMLKQIAISPMPGSGVATSLIGKLAGYYDTAKEEVAADNKAAKEKKDIEDQALKEKVNRLKLTQEVDKKVLEAEKKAAEEKKKATQAAELDIYKATHTTFGNELADIQRKVTELRAKKVEETVITEYAEAAKAKAIQNYADSTLSKINETYKTSLQIRLDGIEREKFAWRQKGIDEVAATKWAEEQKKDALRSAAETAIKNDRKRLEELRTAMAQAKGGGGTITAKDANGNLVSKTIANSGDPLQELYKKWISEDRAKIGIKPGDTFSPELIRMYEEAKKYVAGQLVPGLESSMPVPGLNSLAPGGQKVFNIQSPVNITIDRPLVRDDAMINELAEVVADKITPAMVKALGGSGNGY